MPRILESQPDKPLGFALVNMLHSPYLVAGWSIFARKDRSSIEGSTVTRFNHFARPAQYERLSCSWDITWVISLNDYTTKSYLSHSYPLAPFCSGGRGISDFFLASPLNAFI
jgi:hypothetical protein